MNYLLAREAPISREPDRISDTPHSWSAVTVSEALLQGLFNTATSVVRTRHLSGVIELKRQRRTSSRLHAVCNAGGNVVRFAITDLAPTCVWRGLLCDHATAFDA